MATTLWARSGDTQIRKSIFEPAYSTTAGSGATCDFFQGGTTTPLVVFFDSEENQAAGSQVTVDAQARWPNIFVPTGNPYDYTIKDFNGEVITQVTNVPNPDPAPSAAPPPTTFVTGMTIWMQQDATLSDWVRANNRTIGSASSGATERANDDTQPLFEFIWNNSTDETNPVSGGRGSSASADFIANKTIRLPDMRGGAPTGIDTMGNTASGSFVNILFDTGDATTVGSLAGYNSRNINISSIAPHSHDNGTLIVTNSQHTHAPGNLLLTENGSHNHIGTTDTNNLSHSHPGLWVQSISTTQVQSGVGVAPAANAVQGSFNTGSNDFPHAHNYTTDSAQNHRHFFSGETASNVNTPLISGSTGETGGANNFGVLNKTILGTWYIKI